MYLVLKYCSKVVYIDRSSTSTSSPNVLEVTKISAQTEYCPVLANSMKKLTIYENK